MATQGSNKRIVKNTLYLYCRMFITMAIGMWTSRIVLNALGFTDQGLYNLVGGFVGMFSLVTSAIGTSISRFITYETGRGDKEQINKVIGNAITVQTVLAAIILLLGETIGLWFLNNKLVIPADRLTAVHIVYQLSLARMVLSLLTSAPNGLIMANERMNVFAMVAIISSIASFGIAMLIAHYGYDRLILFSVLHFIVSVLTLGFYRVYVHHTFRYVRYKLGMDRRLFKDMFAFAGWNTLGQSAGVLRNSGIGVLLNIFGGPIANTINGIANSVNNLAMVFVKDFTTAYNPQITKLYANKEYSRLVPFLNQCSKFTYCLLMIIAVPVLVHTDALLTLWLKEIPTGTVIFARIIVCCSLVDTLSYPLIYAAAATGDIRNYQLVVGTISLIALPLAYIFLKLGFPIYYAYVAILITFVIALVGRLVMIRKMIPGWNTFRFITDVIARCAIATILGGIFQTVLYHIAGGSTISVIAQCIAGAAFGCAMALYVACNRKEHKALIALIHAFLVKAHVCKE